MGKQIQTSRNNVMEKSIEAQECELLTKRRSQDKGAG
jgi:hypothetical protein